MNTTININIHIWTMFNNILLEIMISQMCLLAVLKMIKVRVILEMSELNLNSVVIFIIPVISRDAHLVANLISGIFLCPSKVAENWYLDQMNSLNP